MWHSLQNGKQNKEVRGNLFGKDENKQVNFACHLLMLSVLFILLLIFNIIVEMEQWGSITFTEFPVLYCSMYQTMVCGMTASYAI